MTFIWPVDQSGLPKLPEVGDPPSAEYIQAATERNAALSLAVQIMHRLSGRQFGLAEHTVRPCRGALRNDHGPGPVTSYLLSWEGDRWVNWSCGCIGGCRLTGPRQVHLPGPVHSVTEVKIADAVLPPNVWVVEGNVLYRRETTWPPQDLGRPLGEPNTWSVTYKRGIQVPAGVAELTGILAKELLKAIADGGRECRLPRTVTVASRQGITYRAYDPAVIYKTGKVGIPEIDLWLASVNPSALAAAPSVI